MVLIATQMDMCIVLDIQWDAIKKENISTRNRMEN